MKIIIAICFLLLTCTVAALGGDRGERGFFDGTYPMRTELFKIPDRTVEGEYIILQVYYASSDLEWTVLESKDLYLELTVEIQPARSQLEIYVADCYFEQIIAGGQYDGISFYRDSLGMGDHTLIYINETIPYRGHIQLPGFDWVDNDQDYPDRLKGDGITIGIEFQLFCHLPDGKYYQDYIVDQFTVTDGEVGDYEGGDYQSPVFTFSLAILVCIILVIKRKARS